jgi:steroid 5-alpha reductase family enzyme
MSDIPAPPSRGESLARVCVIYVVAMLVGAAVVLVGPWPDLLTRLLAADVLATLLVYSASVGAGNTSVYDPYWSVIPIAILAGVAFLPEAVQADPQRLLMILGVVLAWGVRLTWNWARSWTGLHHEDWRYVGFRERHSRPVFEFINLFGLHMFPTVMVFLGLIPAVRAMVDPTPVGTLAWVGLSVSLLGVLFELVSDIQLVKHRRSGAGGILKSGLWAWSRHPNYFGEILFWWGLFVFGLDAGPEHWWTGAGALAITLMFVFVSVPLIERRMAQRREGWEAHAARTSVLVPLPPKRGGA